MMENKGRVAVVLDSQAGSCGKGKFAGYLAQADKFDVAIDNFMSNAGHTYVDKTVGTVMTQHLPTSIVNPVTDLIIGAGSVITPSILFNEIIHYKEIIGDRPIIIHPRAMVILPEHAEREKELIRSGSTFKGCGVAQADKIMRVPGVQLFGDWYKYTDWSDTIDTTTSLPFTPDDIAYITETIEIEDSMLFINNCIDCNYDILIEGSQGCDLDINFGLNYPHTTSRQCHASQLVADCGISPRLITDIIMVMRPYPIRISNTTNIGIEVSSGDYDGAEEISWDIVRERCGAPADIQFGEMTTVTKKMRRVFEMNWDRLHYVTQLNRPTCIALNFVQYIDYNALGCREWKNLPGKVQDFINKVERITGVKVGLIGTGADNEDIIDRR
jgi:adenylosuccinate synthase